VDRATAIRARLARATRFGEPPEVIISLRADYYAARAREYVRDWLASDPAPTSEHRRELADLLVGGEADGTAAA
jgi:hypothetical protein